MSERSAPPPSVGSTPRPARTGSVAPSPLLPWESYFPTLPLDQQQDLLERLSSQAIAAVDLPLPTAGTLSARLLATDPHRLPKFLPVAHGPSPHPATVVRALAVALGCPDVLLVDAAGVQATLAADIAAEAGLTGERVLVLSPTPAEAEAVVARLACEPTLLVGRALAPDEPIHRLPECSAQRTARSHSHEAIREALTRTQSALVEHERQTQALSLVPAQVLALQTLASRRRELDSELAQLSEPIGSPSVEPDPILTAERSRILSELTKATQTRDELRQAQTPVETECPRTNPRKSGIVATVLGWLHRHDTTSSNPVPSTPTLDLASVEAQIQQLEAEQTQVEVAIRQQHEKQIDERMAQLTRTRNERRDQLQSQLGELDRSIREQRESWAALGFPIDSVASLEQVVDLVSREQPDREKQSREVESIARRWVADLTQPSPKLVSEFLKSVRVVVATPEANSDPLIGAAEFDRAVMIDADRLLDLDWPHFSVKRWVLIGDPTGSSSRGRNSPQPYPAPRHSRNGVHRPDIMPDSPPATFRQLWRQWHHPKWTIEGGRLVAVLTSETGDRLRREPLADRPEIELRFTQTETGDSVLAEVAFPARMPFATAKAFLAQELGEIRLVPVGLQVWHEGPDRLTICWPAAEAAGNEVEWIEVAPGIREKVSGHGPEALTAAVSFERSAGWDRAAAEQWLAVQCATTQRTITLPRPATAPEPSRSRQAAGVAG